MNTKHYLHLVCCLALLLVSGCMPSLFQSAQSHSPSQQEKKGYIALNKLKPKDYQKAIVDLEREIRQGISSPQALAEAHRRLALLYLLPNNPMRNEKKAAKALRSYVKMSPEGTERLENSLWLQLLEEKLALGERKRKELTACDAEKQRLAEQAEDLSAKNTKLNEDIEKLKLIDLSVEKKRKSFH